MHDAKTEKAPTSGDTDLFAPLQYVGLARKGGGVYYSSLLGSSDELVRFGAYCQMLTLKVLPASEAGSALDLANYAAIKVRAFDFFEGANNIEAAERVANTPTQNPDIARTALMKAELAFDHAGARDAHAAMFRDSGDVRELTAAARSAEHVGSWRAAAEWYLRAMAIVPVDPHPCAELYRILGQANQFDLIEKLNRLLSRAGLHPFVTGVFGANVLLSRSDANGCLTALSTLTMPSANAPPALRPVQAHALRLAAEAKETLGDYQGSYRSYVEMNRLELAPEIDGKTLTDAVKASAAASYPSLPPLRCDDLIMHLGFPRSGTTLLEIALDAHPDIETLEETPPWDAAMTFIRLKRNSGLERRELLVKARDLYFFDVTRRRKNVDARFVVDKYPLRTIHAVPLSKLLPEQKYIFSIRHPFDTVLSCFRQRFQPNHGMEHFRTFEAGVEFYDFAMRQWFAVHHLNDPLVHYIKYDRLVMDFDVTVGGVLDFIGAPWDNSVRNFAEGAMDRVALTPSYQKIRKGLSIGVQTSWRNYGFLFEAPEAKPLFKWAEHFGYETK